MMIDILGTHTGDAMTRHAKLWIAAELISTIQGLIRRISIESLPDKVREDIKNAGTHLCDANDNLRDTLRKMK